MFWTRSKLQRDAGRVLVCARMPGVAAILSRLGAVMSSESVTCGDCKFGIPEGAGLCTNRFRIANRMEVDITSADPLCDFYETPGSDSNGNTCVDCLYKPHGAAGFCKHKDHRKGEKDQKYRNITDNACSEFIPKTPVKQIILRSQDGGIRVIDIPAEKIDPQSLTIQELIEEYRKTLY